MRWMIMLTPQNTVLVTGGAGYIGSHAEIGRAHV